MEISEYSLVRKYAQDNLNELLGYGIDILKYDREYCIIGNHRRINVHRIDNPICKDLIDTILTRENKQLKYQHSSCKRDLLIKAPIKLLVSYLGPIINQFEDVVFIDSKFCFYKKDNEIYKRKLFVWGNEHFLRMPEIVEKNDLIYFHDCLVRRSLCNENDHQITTIFQLIYIFDNKLVYRFGKTYYFDKDKIELRFKHNLGYKSLIVSIGDQIDFLDLEKQEIVHTMFYRAKYVEILQILDDEFLKIDNKIFFNLKEVAVGDIPRVSGLLGKFAVRFDLLEWAFSFNLSEISGIFTEKVRKSTFRISNMVDLDRGRNLILDAAKYACEEKGISIEDSVSFGLLKNVIKYNTETLKDIVHRETLKNKNIDSHNSFLIFIFFYFSKDLFFMNCLTLMLFEITNHLRLFFIENITCENRKETYKMLKDTIKVLFKPSEYNNCRKFIRNIAHEIVNEEKIQFSDMDIENRRKKASSIRSNCFIGDTLIEFGLLIKIPTRKEDGDKTPKSHLKLRKFRWQKLKNSYWKTLRGKILQSDDILQQITRTNEENNKKMIEKIKGILLKSENNKDIKENGLIFQFLSNTDVPLKIMEEKVQNKDMSDLSRIVFAALYCIRERGAFGRKSRKSKFPDNALDADITIKKSRDQAQSTGETHYVEQTIDESAFPIKFNTKLTISECFVYYETNNGLVSLFLNGILNISSVSQLAIEKLRRSPNLNKPEEVFFSQIFISIIQINRDENFHLNYKEILKKELMYKKCPKACYYAIAGRLFFIALYFLFYSKEDFDHLLKCKQYLLNKCLKWEEMMKKDDNFTIIFNYCLICLSLLENIEIPGRKRVNINLIRIIRRKILETREMKNYKNDETFFVNILTPNEDLVDEDSHESKVKISGGFSDGPIHFGHTELYKICLGLTLLRPKNLHIRGKNAHKTMTLTTFISIIYLLLIFYPIWPCCPSDQIEFHQIRNLIFLIIEKDGIKYTLKRRNSVKDFGFKKYFMDLLSDFAEKNDEDDYVWKDLINMMVDGVYK